jgi:hypothetical protein
VPPGGFISNYPPPLKDYYPDNILREQNAWRLRGPCSPKIKAPHQNLRIKKSSYVKLPFVSLPSFSIHLCVKSADVRGVCGRFWFAK